MREMIFYGQDTFNSQSEIMRISPRILEDAVIMEKLAYSKKRYSN